MTPPQAIPILGQMEDTPVQISHLWSWWVPYLNKGCRPDFNNDLGGDSNSGPVLAPFCPPGVYLSPTRIIAPPRATPILCQKKYTSVQVSYLWFPGGYNDLNSDLSKQIRLCTRSGARARNSQVHLDMLTSLDQSTQ